MSDRLKFRVWNFETKEYIFFNGIFNSKPTVEMSSFPQYDSFRRPVKLGEPEQCIAHEDAIRVTIFESDTVLIPDGWGGDCYYPERIATVVRCEDGWGLEGCDGENELICQDWSWDMIQIIGSIHENGDAYRLHKIMAQGD